MDKTIYRIELWNNILNRYECYWSHHSLEIAERQMNKSYNRRHTRRLVKVETTIVKKVKAKESY